MKSVHLQILALAVLGFSLPTIAFAQFRGPAQSPTGGNVPGVIWNTYGTTQPQSNASINISGSVTTTAPVYPLNDLYLQSGRSFRIDQNGSAAFYFGNWFGGSSGPLTVTTNGDIYANWVAPTYIGSGNEGRVQARKFCLYPGTNPSDCISPSTGGWANVGAGTYVLKAGDSMSGELLITNNSGPGLRVDVSGGNGGFGGEFTGKTAGLQGYVTNSSGAVAVYGQAPGSSAGVQGVSVSGYGVIGQSPSGGGVYGSGSTALYGLGTTYGADLSSNNIGARITAGNTAVSAVASNVGSVGGSFTGETYGVRGISTGSSAGSKFGGWFSSANGYGISVDGPTSGVFTNNTGFTSYVAAPTIGFLASVPTANDLGFWTNGKVQILGDMTVNNVTGVDVTVNGDFRAPNNTLANCAWQAWTADGTTSICPSTAPLMHGFQRNAANTQSRINCCDL